MGLAFSELTKEILSVDVIFCMVLVWLELCLQQKFQCPCGSNRFFSVSLCVCSSILIMLISLFIQIYKYKEELQKHNWRVWKTWQDNWTALTGVVLPLLISLFTWLTLWFFRGNYYICQETVWDETRCRSDSDTVRVLLKESLVISMGLFIVLTGLIMVYIIYLVFVSFNRDKQIQRNDTATELSPRGPYRPVAHGDEV